MRTDDFDYDVAIVGYGPVGAVAANLLGTYGVRTAVFERETLPCPLPRAMHMSDDVRRILQNAGLGEGVDAVVAPAEKIQFVGGGGGVLAEARVPADGEYGYPAGNLFYQPELEAVLRRGVERFSGDGGVRVFLGHAVEGLSFGEDGATLTVVGDGGEGRRREVRARFVLGSDGARSVVRRAAGIPLRSLGFDQDWVVVDAELLEGAPGGDDPPMLRQVLDPDRPTTRVTLRGNRRRWEFMLLPGETGEGMQRPSMVRELLAPHVDLDGIRIVRATGYRFHGLIARSWRNGPLFLLGDAAHQMPPFLGQGLGEGIRDAHNLAWKLRLVLEGAADPVLLDSYETERAPHAAATTKQAIRVGRVVGTRNRALAALRDAALKLVGRLPIGTYGPAGDAMKVDPSLGAGAFAGRDRGKRRWRAAEGELFVQPPVRTRDGETLPLDEVLGPGWAVLARDREVLRHLDARARAFWGRIGARFLAVVPADAPLPTTAGDAPLLLADVEGRLAGWFGRHDAADAVILRPDRHVWGVFDAGELGTATIMLRAQLAAPEGPWISGREPTGTVRFAEEHQAASAAVLDVPLPPIRIKRVQHVAVFVSDVARSRRFYEQTLGLRYSDVDTPGMAPAMRVTDQTLCFMSAGDLHHDLVLVHQGDHRGNTRPVTPDAFATLAWTLRPGDTLGNLAGRLKALGVPVETGAATPPPGQEERPALRFRDPDGHAVEVHG